MATRTRLFRMSLLILPATAALWAAACGGSDTETPAGSAAGQGGNAAGTGTATGGQGGATTTSGTGGNGAGGENVGGAGGAGCQSDGDCTADPNATVCDTTTGLCVGCLPTNDLCDPGQFCDPATNQCTVGCTDDADCDPANGIICNTQTHQCVGCVIDTDCPAGSICVNNSTCVPGCSPTQACQAGSSCCGTQCFDLTTDENHCGDCLVACVDPPNGDALCQNSQCGLGACGGAFADCNNDPVDGCEWNVLQDGPCLCAPGDTQPCYQGAVGTQNVGPCVGGTQTCAPSGLSWGACAGQVLPSAEVCANGVDEDCTGVADDVPDVDGDGWSTCQNDCCDSLLNCSVPSVVNPGAFEVAGNGVDDDCDGIVDNPIGTCDAGLASNSAVATDYAKAIDLCATTTENPALPQKKWGVISANLFRANGAGSPNANSRSIRQGFGTNVVPLNGVRIAVLSTGAAAAQNAPNNTNPAYATFQTGQDMGTTSPVPADWLAANGNNFPNAPGCPDPNGGTTAYDPVMLKVRVRVPTNAKSFSVASYFYSAEYPEYVCSAFNDFFLTLLDSTFVPGPGETPNPADKNLAFYDPPPAGGAVYPIGVNLAFGNTGLFSQCKNGQVGCLGGMLGNQATCVSQTGLAGTGFQIVSGGCGTNDLLGGGTGWLTTSGNVEPGETVELRFVIWDTGDHIFDSLVLLDNFIWSLDAAQPGTHN